jgi:hypothetical protein
MERFGISENEAGVPGLAFDTWGNRELSKLVLLRAKTLSVTHPSGLTLNRQLAN